MTAPGSVCERCGTPVPPGARFCISCGADTSAPQGQAATRQITVAVTKQVKDSLLQTLRDITLGEYEILVELGRGGMATVYLAHDLQLDRKVAIKVMHPELLTGEGMAERFKLEARTAAGLSHPNIIPIHAVKEEEDLLLFVMKFIEGRPLDSIIKEVAPLPFTMVRHVVGKVAEALGYAHRRGVIHRDIKPANIMVDTEGHPIVTDFGIAKVAEVKGLTMTGAAIGTPTYMSPEQCHALPITGASDQYSLGVMAYEMLTGKPVFDGTSVMSIMFKHVNDPPAPVREQVPSCPPDLAQTIERMLAKKPEDRFPSMEDVVKAINPPTLAFDDPVRTQLVQLALAGENRKVLQRVSTPRSPIPAQTSSRGRTRTRADQTSPSAATSIITPRRVVPAPKSGNRGLLIGGIVLVLGTGTALAVLKPWATKVSPPGDTATQAIDTGSAGTPPRESVPTSSTADTQTATPTPPPQQRPPIGGPVSSQQVTIAVQSVRVSGNASLSVGETSVLQADPLDVAGRVLAGRAVEWGSSAPEVVSVSGTGQVTAREAGRAVITATADGVRGSLAVTVTPEAVASLTVSPRDLRLEVGGSSVLSVRVVGASGRVLSRPVEWSSSAPAVAAVSTLGTVTALAPGSAVITAETGGQGGNATVTVSQPGPNEADLKAQVAEVIQGYAHALQAKDIAQVRELFPGMTSERERQLHQALPSMQNLQVRLRVGDVRISGETATASVTGHWTFTTDGRSTDLPADNTYQLARRGSGWVITDIR